MSMVYIFVCDRKLSFEVEVELEIRRRLEVERHRVTNNAIVCTSTVAASTLITAITQSGAYSEHCSGSQSFGLLVVVVVGD